MLDISACAIPIHEFGWRVKQRRPLAFTNSGDDPFARLVSARTPRMLQLVPGGMVCRNYLVREPTLGAAYSIVTTVDALSGKLIPADEEALVKANIFNMLGSRWHESAGWAARLCYTRRVQDRLLAYLYANGGEMPPIRWLREPADCPEVTLRESGGALTILLSEVPEGVPFPACARKIVQRGTIDAFQSMLQLPPPADA